VTLADIRITSGSEGKAVKCRTVATIVPDCTVWPATAVP
jgi:hypothetical protein